MDEKARKELTLRIQENLGRRYAGCSRNSRCPCPGVSCPVHGNCAACLAWHRDHALKPLPHCLRVHDKVSFEMYDAIRNIEGGLA